MATRTNFHQHEWNLKKALGRWVRLLAILWEMDFQIPIVSKSDIFFKVTKAVRATLILFPLLGLTNLLFFLNPKTVDQKENEFMYLVVNAVLKSSQVSSLLLH